MLPAARPALVHAALCIGAAFLLVALFQPMQAMAHRRSAGEPQPGIPIASLTHGQMAVIARHRSEILDLAARQTRTDEPFRRLMNFGNIQYSYCLWGLVPGSMKDEESPFNECSHAYLAAARTLLAAMQKMPGAGAADALVSQIDADMVRAGSSWVMCQYSDEPFSTGQVIVPRWSGIFGHPASLATFALAAMALMAGGLALFRQPVLPRPPRRPAP